MPLSDQECFELLKQSIEAAFKQRHPACSSPISEWKGQQIVDFQEDLIAVVRGRISEKWFYTHIRQKTGKNSKLPRIDMLHMLSAYAGFKDWQDFLFNLRGGPETKESEAPDTEETGQIRPADQNGRPEPPSATEPRSRRIGKRSVLIAASVLAAVVLTLFLAMKSNTTYTFCFVDADQGHQIADQKIEITILMENESPIVQTADDSGCFQYQTRAEKIRFVVNSPYYKADTVTRFLDKEKTTEQIKLETDDYALMIHLFSTSKVQDWRKRRKQLNGMLAESAEIFQLSANEEVGMEIYTKEEFIDKMTMPVKSLRNIEIIETKYDRRGQIIGMRFVQKDRK